MNDERMTRRRRSLKLPHGWSVIVPLCVCVCHYMNLWSRAVMMRVKATFLIGIIAVLLIVFPIQQICALSSSSSRSYASISSSSSTGKAGTSGGSVSMKQPNKIKVAIIGGGIAGLSCAQHLTTESSLSSLQSSSSSSVAFDVTVFDTGRLRPGGRCASRLPGDRPKENDLATAMSTTTTASYSHLSKYIIDHAAQVISIPASSSSSTSSSNVEQQQQQEKDDDSSSSPFVDFYHQVQAWESRGVVTRFPPNSLCCIEAAAAESSLSNENDQKPFVLKPIPSSSTNTQAAAFFYGTKGMASIPLAMVKEMKQGQKRRGGAVVEIKQDVWVSPSNGARYIFPKPPDSSSSGSSSSTNSANGGKWKLQAGGGRVLGYYDQLVIAHNGKCADRLMSNTPAKSLHRLLQVNFAASVEGGGGRKMTLNSIYSLTFVISKSKLSQAINNNGGRGQQKTLLLEEPFISGFVQNEPALRFLTCQTRKHPAAATTTKKDDTSKLDDDDDLEVWTVLSSPSFATKYKAPQEFLPPDTVQQVTSLLLQAVERCCLGITGSSGSGSPVAGGAILESSVLESRLQLWGAALPLNTWQSFRTTSASRSSGSRMTRQQDGFLYDAEHSVGVCGDWLLEPSIAGAWTSGRRLANHLIEGFQYQQQGTAGRLCRPATIGLDKGKFCQSHSASQLGIGALDVSISTPTSTTAAAPPRNNINKGRPSNNKNINSNKPKDKKRQPQQNPRAKQSRTSRSRTDATVK